MEIVTKSIGECWLKSIDAVMENGSLVLDEDVNLKEVLSLAVKIENPDITDQLIYRYGDPDIIKHTLKKFEKDVVMEDRPFTYAERIYDKHGIDQYEWLLERVRNKKETKSATICLLNEGDDSPNIPCLTTIDVKIRDNALDLQFFYRSQNIIGRQYANYLALAKLQKDLAKDLNTKVGFMAGYIASAHIYEYDFDYAESLRKGNSVQIKDLFYKKGPKSIRAMQ
uniref:thymidylate synthase n=1 Tax=Succinivibrio sp. TaxID=2053619 RepID=UPI00402AC565